MITIYIYINIHNTYTYIIEEENKILYLVEEKQRHK